MDHLRLKAAEEIGVRYNSTVEKVEIITERQGLIPVFIDRKAIIEETILLLEPTMLRFYRWEP